MKKYVTRILLVLLVFLLLCIGIFTGIYFTRFRTMSSIQKISSYDDGYNLSCIEWM